MKSARPTEVNASALDQRPHHSASDLVPDTLPAAAAPILPKPGTVKDRALAALIAGKITQAEFRFSWRLAAYIDELVDDGWAIASEWITLPGWAAPIKRYWIDLQDETTRAAVAAYRGKGGAQ